MNRVNWAPECVRFFHGDAGYAGNCSTWMPLDSALAQPDPVTFAAATTAQNFGPHASGGGLVRLW